MRPSSTLLYASFSAIALIAFTPAVAQVFNADVEPNNHFANAVPIQYGVAFEGQLYHLTGDETDIYSFVLPEDGVLLLQVEAEQNGTAADHLAVRASTVDDSLGVTLYSYYDGPPAIGDNNVPVLSNVRLSCMKAGFHYLRVGRWIQDTTTNARSYRITATLRPMAFADDPEPNNDIAASIPVAQGNTAEGHLSVDQEGGPVMNNDIFDLWTLTKTDPGPLVVYTEIAFEGDLNDPYTQIVVSGGNDSIVSDIDYEGKVVFGQNGVPLSDTAVFYTASAPGTYHLYWHNPVAAPCWAYRFSYATGTVGMNEQADALDFSVFPNPANGPVEIRGRDIDRVEVIDPSGRRMAVIPMQHRTMVRWQPASSAEGFYFLRAFGEDGSISTLRLTMVR